MNEDAVREMRDVLYEVRYEQWQRLARGDEATEQEMANHLLREAAGILDSGLALQKRVNDSADLISKLGIFNDVSTGLSHKLSDVLAVLRGDRDGVEVLDGWYE